MVLFGVLFMLGSAGTGGYLAWQNRHTVVHARLGGFEWTGHLWIVLAIGALLAAWFVLGAAFIQCRVAERRRAKRAAAGTEAPLEAPVATPAGRTVRRGRPGAAVLSR